METLWRIFENIYRNSITTGNTTKKTFDIEMQYLIIVLLIREKISWFGQGKQTEVMKSMLFLLSKNRAIKNETNSLS